VQDVPRRRVIALEVAAGIVRELRQDGVVGYTKRRRVSENTTPAVYASQGNTKWRKAF